MNITTKKDRFIKTIAMLLSYHIISLIILSLFRVIEFIALHKLITQSDANIAHAFFNGLWFDNVTMCYISIVPIVTALLCATFKLYNRKIRYGIYLWYCILGTIVILVSASNTPYFAYFFKNINSSIFQWFGYASTTVGMLWQESSFWVYIITFFIIETGFIYSAKRIRKYFDKCITDDRLHHLNYSFIPQMGISVLLISACLFGIRGRIGYNPIKVSEAYYCNDPFLNQLGINPAFNLLTSSLDDMRKENKEISLMNNQKAIILARHYLGINGKINKKDVLRREITVDGTPKKYNVVFILMESMSANLMSTFGNSQPLTPNLDSLYHHSLAFTNYFSAGIHTNHGITASLYSFPALMFRNLMKGTVTPHRKGIPTVLKDYGYHNIFFMSHEAQYDNMKAFLTTNGYDDIYSQETYPKDSVVNSFGVSDHFLFNFALKKINMQAQRRKPFLATILTISNHPPYIIPDFFKSKTNDDETRIVEYADWAIGDFIRKASKLSWYKHTIFVLMADHGKMIGNTSCILPPSYNHIPLIIFGPNVPKQICNDLATQVDVMPTLLGLLNMSYSYNGFGVNLLKHKRQMVFYSADNQIIGRDANHCYIYQPKDKQSFFYNVQHNWNMKEARNSNKFNQLKNYSFAMEQTAQFLLKR